MTLKIDTTGTQLEITNPAGGTVIAGGPASAVVVEAGRGVQGPPGPPGPPGLSYEHTQSSASATWTVNHNLGIIPAVEVRTTGGQVVDADVVHISVNQTQIYFVAPFAGTARFS